MIKIKHNDLKNDISNAEFSEARILELNLNRVDFTKSGICNYYWPVSLHEIESIRNRVLEELISTARSIMSFDAESSDLFYVMFTSIYSEVMAMCQAILVDQRCKKDGYFINLTTQNRLLRMLKTNKIENSHPIITKLRSGTSPLKKLRLPLRFIRDLVMSCREGISRRRLFGVDIKTEIVTLGVQDLAQYSAKKT